MSATPSSNKLMIASVDVCVHSVPYLHSNPRRQNKLLSTANARNYFEKHETKNGTLFFKERKLLGGAEGPLSRSAADVVLK
jgi:hypothetical protein